jgi:hypothetical protein
MPNSNQCITNVGGGCICVVENMSKKWLEYLHYTKNFEEQWDASATRTRRPIEYPLELKEVTDLESWVREEI